MTVALACGFMHHLVAPTTLNFERLHIFLFNLCSGGTLLIYFTEGERNLSAKGKIFYGLSLLFALSAFMEWYGITLVIPLLLALIIESVRIKRFGSFFPQALFSLRENVSRKFHQAALLCLSLGLLISSPVILNSVYTNWFTIEKLKLDTFFLGFSFPLSLISMSVIFALMKEEKIFVISSLKESAFWTINLGVIVFFLFILAEVYVPQVVISVTLFLTVALILYLYYTEGIELQQKAFLTSGILFLMFTSITGILYIFLAFSHYTPEIALPLLRLHAFTALYGWNLSGLAVISRHGDFPIKLHSQNVIVMHWVTVALLCPLGYFYPMISLVAIAAYGWLLHKILFNHGRVDRPLVDVEHDVFDGTATADGNTAR
jgi:hypothetical protein